MTYHGYLRYDGVEIVNESRMQTYIEQLGLKFYNCGQTCSTLDAGLEAKHWKAPGMPYVDVAKDRAPWYDPYTPQSTRFAGLALLDTTNMGHTTYAAEHEELALDGAYVRDGRRHGREMVFRGLLLGADLLACRYGLIWLTTVLMGGAVCRGVDNPFLDYSDVARTLKFYKVTSASPTGDNVFQLNWFQGRASGPTSAEGNTYASLAQSLSQASGEALEPPLDDMLRWRDCLGKRLDFAPVCLSPFDPWEGWRFMVDVNLQEGPRVLSEHTVGGGDPSCSTGAWMEVEFSLIAGNPGVWREPLETVGKGQGLNYAFAADEWLMYKGGAAPPTDDDVFEAPFVWNVEHNYRGIFTILQDKFEDAGGQTGLTPPNLDPLPPPTPPVVDPLCPAVPGFPAIPQAATLCSAPYTGEYNSVLYKFSRSRLPKFYPLSFIFIVRTGDVDVRDVRLLVIPSREGSKPLEIVLTYIPADSYFVIDGVNRRTDVLRGASTNAIDWVSASNLIGTGVSGSAFSYQEVVCPSDFYWEVDVPVEYAASDIDVRFRVSVRDV